MLDRFYFTFYSLGIFDRGSLGELTRLENAFDIFEEVAECFCCNDQNVDADKLHDMRC